MIGNCTAVRFGRIDRGLFTCRRGKVSFFYVCVYGLYKKVKPFIRYNSNNIHPSIVFTRKNYNRFTHVIILRQCYFLRIQDNVNNMGKVILYNCTLPTGGFFRLYPVVFQDFSYLASVFGAFSTINWY